MFILTNHSFWITLVCFTFVLSSSVEPVSESNKSKIQVQKAWARATPPNAKNAAVYMILQNDGPLNDLLLDVQTAAAKIVELHTAVKEKGMMFMQPVKNISVPTLGTTVLKPGGSHMMLIDLKEQLKTGNHIDLTLKFKLAGEIKLRVPIQKSQKSEKGSHEHHDMKHN